MLDIDNLKNQYYEHFIKLMNDFNLCVDLFNIKQYCSIKNDMSFWIDPSDNELNLSLNLWCKISFIYFECSQHPWRNKENKKIVKDLFKKCTDIKINYVR